MKAAIFSSVAALSRGTASKFTQPTVIAVGPRAGSSGRMNTMFARLRSRDVRSAGRPGVAASFDARYGDGLGLGVSLGGGGLFFVVWQASYLHELLQHGIDLSTADRVVGTSAGSLVASVLEAEHLKRFHREIGLLAEHPKFVAALRPAAICIRARRARSSSSRNVTDAEPRDDPAIGHAGAAAQTPAPAVMTRNIRLIVGGRKWPKPALHITAVDAYTGERCVLTKAASVPIAGAAAASSAVPGIFVPQPIDDRRCMDGGVAATGTHLDLLSGCARAVVLALTDGTNVEAGAMTSQAGSQQRERNDLVASG